MKNVVNIDSYNRKSISVTDNSLMFWIGVFEISFSKAVVLIKKLLNSSTRAVCISTREIGPITKRFINLTGKFLSPDNIIYNIPIINYYCDGFNL